MERRWILREGVGQWAPIGLSPHSPPCFKCKGSPIVQCWGSYSHGGKSFAEELLLDERPQEMSFHSSDRP